MGFTVLPSLDVITIFTNTMLFSI